jgi:hypothetical protein
MAVAAQVASEPQAVTPLLAARLIRSLSATAAAGLHLVQRKAAMVTTLFLTRLRLREAAVVVRI